MAEKEKKGLKLTGSGFDEIFKIQMKHYFEKFCKVITDFEIVKLPKKADILIIEEFGQRIADHVTVFTYFKKVNIIEFKSANDRFRMDEDLHKISIYTGGVMLAEKEANVDNTTFTLVTANRPAKLLSIYEKNVQKVKNGVYLIEKINTIPVYVVVIEELELKFENELAILKEFSSKKDIADYVKELLHQVMDNPAMYSELFLYSKVLYRNMIAGLADQEGISMTVVEKNLEELNKEFGLKDKYKLEKAIEMAKKMLAKGMDIESIMEFTELSRKQIEDLKEK